jgi:hypothetical protein
MRYVAMPTSPAARHAGQECTIASYQQHGGGWFDAVFDDGIVIGVAPDELSPLSAAPPEPDWRDDTIAARMVQDNGHHDPSAAAPLQEDHFPSPWRPAHCGMCGVEDGVKDVRMYVGRFGHVMRCPECSDAPGSNARSFLEIALEKRSSGGSA